MKNLLLITSLIFVVIITGCKSSHRHSGSSTHTRTTRSRTVIIKKETNENRTVIRSESERQNDARRTRENEVTETVVVKKIPPGQVKKETGEKSAKKYAPGQVKKETGDKSAKEYAPGQVKKNDKSKSGKANAVAKKSNNVKSRNPKSAKSKSDKA
ncbi:MAG: hypothetical protein ABFR62_12785, partial [Bacteroidota bacterium]